MIGAFACPFCGFEMQPGGGEVILNVIWVHPEFGCPADGLKANYDGWTRRPPLTGREIKRVLEFLRAAKLDIRHDTP